MTVVIRDCVHGDIELTSEEISILDTPQMQRLRGIKQLGTAYLVYPTALHTRFDHCIGTCWLTKRILSSLSGRFSSIKGDYIRLISIAALVHDISHLPFGHTFEDERRVFERHDTRERIVRALDRGELGKLLRGRRLLEPVVSILTRGSASPVPPFGGQLVTGAISADLADYLKRDAMFCGLSQSYDERVFRYLEIDADSHIVFRVGRSGDIREDALSEIISLLRMRYFLSERVYYHHTKVAAGAMISKAVEAALCEGEISLETLAEMDDWSLLNRLLTSKVPLAGRLADMIRRRSLYKRCYILHREALCLDSGNVTDVVSQLAPVYHFDTAARGRAESDLCAESGLQEGQLIVYCPSPDMQLKEADVPITGYPGEAKSLKDVAPRSSELRVLMDAHRRLWRFYVFISPDAYDKAQTVARVCEEYFGFRNCRSLQERTPTTG